MARQTRLDLERIQAIRATVAVPLVLHGSSGVPDADLAAAIRSGITRQTGVKIDTVQCPDDVEARRGETFRCVALASNGQRARVEVRQRDDEGSVSWRLIGQRHRGSN